MLFKRHKHYVRLRKRKKEKTEFVFDIGLGILRLTLAFLVVISHCYNFELATGIWKEIIKKTETVSFHVRVFFMMSFYFSYKTLVSSNYKKIFDRFLRLLIPYILWPIIILLLNNNLLIKFSKIKKRIFTKKDLKYQLLTASGYMLILWFQWNLIFVTILYIIIILLFKRFLNLILILMAITAFIYQYNGKNQKYFAKYPYFELHNYGRILELIPYSVAGFLISSSGIIKFFKKFRLKTIITCLYIIYFILYYDIFTKINGHMYQGVKMFLVSICIFIVFAMFPSEIIKNKIIIKIIKQLTNHTAGVYYLHINLYEYLYDYNIHIKNRTIKGCMINYLICYLICFIGSFIFGKTKLRSLFE